MKKFFSKISGRKGFTLTEVLIGISILTVAIVSATSLLMTIVQSNRNNVKTLQAFYYAQEGIEAFRNIRDTNWLHNQNWLGEAQSPIWGGAFVPSTEGNMYLIESNKSVFGNSPSDVSEMSAFVPWSVSQIFDGNKVVPNEENGLKRVIYVYSYACDNAQPEVICPDYARVVSRVFWTDGGTEKEVKLNEIFTNWKGGVL